MIMEILQEEFVNNLSRSKMEMILDILKAVQTPCRITKVMYATNTNCSTLKSYLAELEGKGLIQFIRIKKLHANKGLTANPIYLKSYLYLTTDRGTNLLVSWNRFKKDYDSAMKEQFILSGENSKNV